ncbi:hypothetical protein BAUCODRAFT_32874 [Baudoinia panamericana UAMH 10762]|uniref:Guanine nucleotide-exchange factor SEC12 n=1 Tax=Baudoinia panamericana (strain UAMH 10762) TaxID=717646 RepID=M2NDY9_BAUPA|nr:uncharacterized protein BAUCODRAFT_32874 [Baudoinia panamericana UAMH 10762]EMC97135.1 hypothetical protein BAUCODRAFT_32874 [Baudoinia panamericana UAMH 10762]
MPHQMNSKVSYAKATLPYPVFAADFDPYNRGYLVVGGGGGESKTGVPNQISVLDISNRASISTAAEVELSRDEDSVQSLANLATKDGLIVFAGINGSQANQNAGKNEHLRSFDVKYPPRKKQRTEKDGAEPKGEIKQIGKRSLFRSAKADKSETYQRILRLSPAHKRESGSKRIGAVATGMAKSNEIVVFSATSATPSDSDVIARIDLPEDAEATDLDIVETDESVFSMAYCTDYDIYEQSYKYNFGSKKVEKTPNGPRRVQSMPYPDAKQDPKSRSKYRCLRFLNGQSLVALANKPNKSGAELQIIHLYPTGPASIQLQKTLPSHIRQSVSMDVCALDADKNGNCQVIVAIASQDISIEVYVTNYQAATDTFSPFKHYLILRDVHQHQMTKICFSPFHSPLRAEDPENGAKDASGKEPPRKAETMMHPGPQYVRLASVSYGNTVVVDTFPLSPFEPKDKHSRYVLNHPSDERFTQISFIVVISLVVLVAAFLIQSFTTGFSSDWVGPFSLLPRDARELLDRPASAAAGFGRGMQHTVSSVVESAVPSGMPGKGRLQELLAAHGTSPDAQQKALVIRDGNEGTDVSVDVHADTEEYLKRDTKAKRWHELDEQQKASWKQKLIRAGRWAESEGESVLVSVLFSEYAGLVGQVARGVLNG